MKSKESREPESILQKKISDFSALLDTINSLSDKKKELWKQIYENAVTDREAAYTMYNELFRTVMGKSTEHAVHGQNINKYIERMSKANDQLIKLAELIATAESKEQDINPDDVFDKISK